MPSYNIPANRRTDPRQRTKSYNEVGSSKPSKREPSHVKKRTETVLGASHEYEGWLRALLFTYYILH